MDSFVECPFVIVNSGLVLLVISTYFCMHFYLDRILDFISTFKFINSSLNPDLDYIKSDAQAFYSLFLGIYPKAHFTTSETFPDGL